MVVKFKCILFAILQLLVEYKHKDKHGQQRTKPKLAYPCSYVADYILNHPLCIIVWLKCKKKYKKKTLKYMFMQYDEESIVKSFKVFRSFPFGLK